MAEAGIGKSTRLRSPDDLRRGTGLTDDNHRLTSPASNEYNCIAWSAAIRNTGGSRVYWPIHRRTRLTTVRYPGGGLPRLGFEVCRMELLNRVTKVALYCRILMYTIT